MSAINYERAEELAKELGIDLDDPIVGMEDDPEARVEHFLHEVGHALSLRLPLAKSDAGLSLPTVVGCHIDGNDEDVGRKFREEATVLAAEYRFYTITGVAEQFLDERQWEGLAKDQGCSTRQWERALRSPRTFHLTAKLIVYLAQQGVLCGPYITEAT